jgi:hypothetical protein
MTKRKSFAGVLIVVELGAEWPSLAETRDPASARRVLAQAEGESPAEFGARVAEQLDQLFGRGVPPTTAVVACNERLDLAAQRARSEVARLAMGAMAKLRSGSLLLCASDRNSGRSRHGLSSLASELGSEWQRANVTATVRFGDEPTSGSKSSDMTARVSARGSKESSRRVA